MDVLHDDVLLEIFDFYVQLKLETHPWHLLVHVCRRWRSLVFQSQRRLNLRLFCTDKKSTKDTLDVWPALPLVVASVVDLSLGMDNIITTLGLGNRVCEVSLPIRADWQLEKVSAAMQVPFPELTDLRLSCDGRVINIPIPDSFMGGSVPNLRHFSLSGIPFPGLPNLLLSTNHLVSLRLLNIPHSGYISPEAIVALIPVLSSLEILSIQFIHCPSRLGWEGRSLPPPKRSILPALNKLHFKGITEYFEVLMSLIDTPQLNLLRIAFFDDQVDMDCRRLGQFINRTPTLKAFDEARVEFSHTTVSVILRHRTSQYGADDLEIVISRIGPDRQLSSIEQVCNTSLPLVSTVEDLYIKDGYLINDWKDDGIEDTLWLQLLHPFTGVRNLYLFKAFAPGIAAALKGFVGGRITEVLPVLQNIFVDGLEPTGPFQENIGRFVAARQLSDHPIAVSDWDTSVHGYKFWRAISLDRRI